MAHEANFEYLLKKTLDEMTQESPNYQGLVTELEPSISKMGRADLLVKDGLKPLIIFETKKSDQDVDSLQVHRKTREYALNIRAEYFVISNLTHTYLFKNDMGPLRELQIKLWDSHSPMNIKLVLNEILNISLHQTAISSRKEIFLERYKSHSETNH